MFENIINEKIELLHDFCVLNKRAPKQEQSVRDILSRCKSEIEIERKLHDVLRGYETLKQLIKREETRCIN